MPTDHSHPRREGLLVAIGGRGASIAAVELGKRLAEALDLSWDAIHVETPGRRPRLEDPELVGEALLQAAQLGASVARIPADSAADGILQHIENWASPQIVIGHRPALRRGLRLDLPLADQLMARRPDVVIHAVVSAIPDPARRQRTAPGTRLLPGFAWAALAVAVTLSAALLLNRTTGVRSLSILFLFPVIAAAARHGIGPAIAAALLSSAAFNIFFLPPPAAFDPLAVQSWVMAGVLLAVALYTGALTAHLRGRLALADRSAQQNAALAAFAERLTRVSNWTATAEAVCEHVGEMLKVRTILVREISGKLETVASFPAGLSLDPLDIVALDWTWTHGEPTGRGTSSLAGSDWQFQPLKTSLGTLAVLGLARDDGRAPVEADQAVLLSTVLAQAALAHERLRLEDLMRAEGSQNASPAATGRTGP